MHQTCFTWQTFGTCPTKVNRTDSSNYSNMAPLYRILEIRPDMYVTPPVYNTERPKTLGLYLNSLPRTIVVGQYPTLISAELNEERACERNFSHLLSCPFILSKSLYTCMYVHNKVIKRTCIEWSLVRVRSLFYFLPVYRQDGQSAGQVSFEKFTTRECVCVMRTLLDSRNI